MTEDKNILETIKKVELGDLKILIIGVVLLAVPAGLLIYLLSQGSSEGYSRESLRHMGGRRSTFNFKTSRSNSPARGASGKKNGWLSKETSAMKVERELDEAMKEIERSSRARSSSMGSSNSIRMKSYAAETDFAITSANGAMEQGSYLEAEKYYEDAFQRGDRNVFLKLQAIAGLCEVYSRTENQKKYEEAFDIYMKIVAQLPPGVGGGDLRASVRNAFMVLRMLKKKSKPGKVSQAVMKSKIAQKSGIDTAALNSGLDKALKFFPAKFQ